MEDLAHSLQSIPEGEEIDSFLYSPPLDANDDDDSEELVIDSTTGSILTESAYVPIVPDPDDVDDDVPSSTLGSNSAPRLRRHDRTIFHSSQNFARAPLKITLNFLNSMIFYHRFM